MKLSKLLFVIALGIASCDSDTVETCGVTDPINELLWLHVEIQGYSSAFSYADIIISQGMYRHRTVFITRICCPSCNTLPPSVRSCSGRLLGYVGTDIDYAVLENSVTTWRTNNGICP